MTKSEALIEVNRRGIKPKLDTRNIHFANVNASKPVWWLDIPISEIFDEVEPDINLVLAATNHQLYHLRVPKDWLIENIEAFAVREDKDVVTIELSCMPNNLFQDVRPTSQKASLSRFRV